MADAPSTPAAGLGPASPKLVLPPMTVSPGVTRLDRVLDLVTDHEAQFRDHELRVVDLSTRVAAVERAVGVPTARSASFGIVGTPYVEYPDDEPPLDLRSELADVRASVAHLREEVAEALHEVRSKISTVVDETKATKAGFKSVLRDVLDRVASQLDAVRAAQDKGGGSKPFEGEGRHRFASVSDLAALAERVKIAESVAERAGASLLRSATVSPSATPRRTSENNRTSVRLSETERRVELLFEEMRRIKDENDDLKERGAGRASFGSTTFSVDSNVGGVGFVGSESLIDGGTSWNKYMPINDAVLDQLRQLARRFDEQQEQTDALKRVFLEMRAEHDDKYAARDDALSLGKASPSSASRRGALTGSSKNTPGRTSHKIASHSSPSQGRYNSPRVLRSSGGGDETKPEDDGLIRLGFGAYAGESLMAHSVPRRSGATTKKKSPAKIPANAGFVAEAAARSRHGINSRREDADRAAESFREYLAGLPGTNVAFGTATRRLSH